MLFNSSCPNLGQTSFTSAYRKKDAVAVATEPYPVSETLKVIEGYDVYKSNNIWVALVVVDEGGGRKGIKLYRWEKRKKKEQGQVGEGMDDKVWKVGLCRMHVSLWDWQELSGKVSEFKSKYGIK